jgi:ferritin-like metal-binding protein YciE
MPQLEEILTEELRDLLDAEKQLTKALPKMARSSSTPELKQAFLEHLEVTKNQITRLEQVFEAMGQRAKSKPCRAMKGLVEEAQEHISEHEKGKELDCVLISSAQKVEHYEIAGYGTVRTMAKAVGNRQAMSLLNETLKEEEMTDKLLSKVAIQIQKELLQEEGENAAALDEDERRYSAEAQRASSKTGRAPGARGAAASKKK